jgi:hypothetical protein
MKGTKREEKGRKKKKKKNEKRKRKRTRVRARTGRDGLAHNSGTSGERKGYAKTPPESSCTFFYWYEGDERGRKKEKEKEREKEREEGSEGENRKDGLTRNSGTSRKDKRKGYAKTSTESSCSIFIGMKEMKRKIREEERVQ